MKTVIPVVQVKEGDVIAYGKDALFKVSRVSKRETDGCVGFHTAHDTWTGWFDPTDTVHIEVATVNPLEWQSLWDAMDLNPGEWIPTTEDMFTQMLEVVPPRAQVQNSFLLGEAQRHNEQGQAVHACFTQVGDAFFARYLTVEQFQNDVAVAITE